MSKTTAQLNSAYLANSNCSDSDTIQHIVESCTYEELQNNPQLFQTILNAAKLKNPHATYILALCYYNGFNVTQNYQATIKLLKKIKQEHGDKIFAKSRYLLGQCYYNGNGVEQDKERAFRYYRNASRHNKKVHEKFLKSLGY